MSIITLTNNDTFQVGLALFSVPISSSQGIKVSFDFSSYGGSGADGMSFFLMDGAETNPIPGGSGGALGYSKRSTDPASPGLPGGYLGVGFDEFGNYSNPIEGAVLGPGFVENSIAVRGSEAIDYAYLTGSGTLPISLDNTDPSATRENSRKHAQVSFSPDGNLSVFIDLNSDGDFADIGERPIQNFNVVAAGNGQLPATFKFGFAASSGRDTNIHEVYNITAATFNDSQLAGRLVPDLFLVGATTSDHLIGGEGNDTINGKDGHDTLIGVTGNDTIIGGTGRDMIHGGEGADTLSGDDGADLFIYSAKGKKAALRLSVFRTKQRDIITDFDPENGDRLLLDFDENLDKGNRPRKGLYLGKIKGKNLKKATKSIYKDSLPDKKGMQPLQKNQAFIFQFKREFYLGVNDVQSKLSTKNDLFLSLGKAAIDESVGKLSTKDYFANNTVGFEL